MVPESTWIWACIVTLVASVWFFSTVRFQMFPQIACLKTGIVTLIAFVWFFSTVRFQMSHQNVCSRRSKVTLIAFVWFFSTVRFQMFPQIAFLKRGIVTLVAFVWFYSTVSCFVQEFYICILQTKVIIFHLFNCHCVLCFAQMVASNWEQKMIDFWSVSVKFAMACFHFLAALVALHFTSRLIGGSVGGLRSLRAWS